MHWDTLGWLGSTGLGGGDVPHRTGVPKLVPQGLGRSRVPVASLCHLQHRDVAQVSAWQPLGSASLLQSLPRARPGAFPVSRQCQAWLSWIQLQGSQCWLADPTSSTLGWSLPCCRIPAPCWPPQSQP